MSYTPETLKQIVKLGGNLILHQGYTPGTLEELVLIAKSTGAHITIEGVYTPNTITRLIEIGGNNVTIVTK